MRTYQAAQLTNFTNTTTGVVAQFNGESDLQALIGSAYIGSLNSISSVGSLAASVAEATLNRMVFRDSPRISQTLESLNVLDSLTELIRQMKVAGATVLAQTIAATPSANTGTGNGIVNASVRRASDGLVLENAFAETLLLTCDSDSYAGGATAGNEGFTLTGTGSQSNVFAFDWPLGSDASTSLSAIDGAQDNASGNLLTNSSFEDWTSNVPDNWSLEIGTAGTDIVQETGNVFAGSSALRITGDGATLTRLVQRFDISTGTVAELSSQTQYSFNLFIRRDGTAPAAGVLTVDLVDQNGTVIQDAAGTSNTFNIDLTALTTSYASYTGDFRTPVIMPTTVYLRLRLSTALTTGRSVYVDLCSLGEFTQAYTSGPFVAVHAGATPFAVNDFFTMAVTNSRGSGGTLDSFQSLAYRLFPDIGSNELLLPSSSSPTIADALIG